MALEIERKFLVRELPDLRQAKARTITQGYLRADPDASVRIRISDDEAWLTIKGPAQGHRRHEYEYPIPIRDAKEMLGLAVGSLIVKRRYTMMDAQQEWVIDVFEGENAGLTVAEAELPSEDAPLSPPRWAGVEVSGDARYLNANLCRNPFSTWPPEDRAEGPVP